MKTLLVKFGCVSVVIAVLFANAGCTSTGPLMPLVVNQHHVGMDLPTETMHAQCRWPKVQSVNYFIEVPKNDETVLKWVTGLVLGDAKVLENEESATPKAPISTGDAVSADHLNWHYCMRFGALLQEEVWRKLGLATTPEAAALLPRQPPACRGECLEVEADCPNVKAVIYRADGKLKVNDLQYCSYVLSETDTHDGQTSVRIMRRVFDRQRGQALTFKEVISASHVNAVRQLLAKAFGEEMVSARTLENFDFTPQGIRWTMVERANPKRTLITWKTLAPHLEQSDLATRFVNEVVLLFPQSYAEIKLPSVEFKQSSLIDVLTLFSDLGPCQGCYLAVQRGVHIAKRGQTLFISFGGDFLDQLTPAIDQRITSDAELPYNPFKIEITASHKGSITIAELITLLNDQLPGCTLRIEWIEATP